MYATRGYETTALPDQDSPGRKTFLASDHNVAVGTLTIGFDSIDRLLADELFAEEVARLRRADFKICEFAKLAMDRRARSPKFDTKPNSAPVLTIPAEWNQGLSCGTEDFS